MGRRGREPVLSAPQHDLHTALSHTVTVTLPPEPTEGQDSVIINLGGVARRMSVPDFQQTVACLATANERISQRFLAGP
jgi:hypothetical protein